MTSERVNKSNGRAHAKAPRNSQCADVVRCCMQNVQAGGQATETQEEAEGLLGKTMNTLGESANWLLGRDQ